RPAGPRTHTAVRSRSRGCRLRARSSNAPTRVRAPRGKSRVPADAPRRGERAGARPPKGTARRPYAGSRRDPRCEAAGSAWPPNLTEPGLATSRREPVSLGNERAYIFGRVKTAHSGWALRNWHAGHAPRLQRVAE